MADGYNPSTFWNKRFIKAGHTGELNPLLYAYDQPQRLRAIRMSLARAGVSISSTTTVLDIGCGTGDVIELFVKMGAPEVTGVDISDETIAHTQRRFADCRKVNLSVAGIEEIPCPAASFDLVVGINILQHLLDDRSFSLGVENAIRVCKEGGHILIMDFSPVRVSNRRPSPYVIYRTRQEYIDAFSNKGCRLVSEFGLPRIGVRLHRGVSGLGGRIRSFARPAPPPAIASASNENVTNASWSFGLGDLARALVLKLAKPFDHLFAPMPYRYTDMRILIFQVGPK